MGISSFYCYWYGARATSANAIALGTDTAATGNRATAFGAGALATGNRSTVMGWRFAASGTRSFAMGSGAMGISLLQMLLIL